MAALEGVALVTGGAFGIGRATALALAREGMGVVVADIFDEEGSGAVAEIEQQGGQGLYVHADVGSPAEVDALVEATFGWRGRCDLLVSNAAITGHGAPHEFSVADWKRMVDVDLFGSVWLARALLPRMLAADRGHLSFVASGAGFQGIADNAPYCVSKFGIVGLAESLAVYLRDTGVSVSLIVPGAIGGPHADTICVAGAEHKPPEHVEAVKARYREMAAGWPSPAWFAEVIVAGLREGRYYIIQEGPGYEDWLGRTMRDKWGEPEAHLKPAGTEEEQGR